MQKQATQDEKSVYTGAYQVFASAVNDIPEMQFEILLGKSEAERCFHVYSVNGNICWQLDVKQELHITYTSIH